MNYSCYLSGVIYVPQSFLKLSMNAFRDHNSYKLYPGVKAFVNMVL